ALMFTTKVVNVTIQNGQPVPDANQNDIYIQNHGLNTGDHVIYHTDGTVIGGLTNNAIYKVIKVDANFIRLADINTNQLITLTPVANTQSVTHTLRRVADQPIGGLVDGQTYYVRDVNGNTFRLAATLGGPALALTPPPGNAKHTLGTEGIDLTA